MSILWFLALGEFILGMYILALHPWHSSNRHVSFLLLLTSISTLILGIMEGKPTPASLGLPLMAMSAIVPAIPPWVLIVTILVLKPEWSQERWRLTLGAIYGLACLPTLLTLVDGLLGTRLWYSSSSSMEQLSGFLALPYYINGFLAPTLGILNIRILPILTCLLLLFILFFEKRASAYGLHMARLLLATHVVALVIEFSDSTFHTGIDLLITNALFSIVYTIAVFQQMKFKRGFQRGSLRVRIAILILIVALPTLIGIAAFLNHRIGIAISQAQAETSPILDGFQREAWIACALGAILLIAGTWFTIQQAFQPLQALTTTAKAIADGNLDRIAPVEGNDEIGSLANIFNRMTDQMRGLISNLEKRVDERTAELERRVIQLQTAAQVAREAAEIHDLRLLLDQTTQLISERFGFYHVGIFLTDESGEYAILRSANSQGGQRMLARGHKLPIGKVGIVGYVAATARPRIALNVGEDSVFFNNPDLPLTRSEMAIPMKVRGQVIGVLDVQATKPAAFSKDDVEALQILTDQVALAIDNARLLDESQRALKELEIQYGQYTRRAWREQQKDKQLAYVYNRLGVEPAPEETDNSPSFPMIDADHISENPQTLLRQIAVPILIRNQFLGSVVLRRDEDQEPWTLADYNLVEEAVNGISQALENARLLAENQRRAEQERLIGEIAAKVQRSLDVDALMKTAVREIALTTHASRVQIRLATQGTELKTENEAGSRAEQ